MYRIERYMPAHHSEWDTFIETSKNGTFLLNRGFMEYHADRFADYSLLVYKGDKLIALLPAHTTGTEVHSHNGLTYGGLIYGTKAKLADIIMAFRALLHFLHDEGFTKLHIKLVPPIYHKLPAQEIDYTLFVAGAKLVRRDSLCIYDNLLKPAFDRDRNRCIRNGEANGLTIIEEPGFELFWDKILIPNMDTKHGASPIHSKEEIIRLHKKFPENIRQFNVYHEGKIVAGTTVFVTDMVAHPQHISGNADKNRLGSIDFLYSHLITGVFKDKRYFDFGPSNLEQGRKLNESLVFWKESFGARTVVQDFYEVETANYELLYNVLI